MPSNPGRKVLAAALSGALAALVASSTAHPAPTAAPATRLPCLAYILDGNVWLRCGGRTHRVTNGGDITDFAISADAIAWERAQGDIRSFPLSGRPGPYLDPRGGPSRLYASCGTILHVRYGYDQRGFPTGRAVATLQVPGAKPLKIGPYSDFRCSSDRKVVVGTTDGGSTLTEGVPPDQLLAEPSRKYWYLKYQDYDVSPSGSYIAYSTPRAIYVRTNGRTAGEIHDGIADRISVSDTGKLLYTTDWWEEAPGQPHVCYYKDAWHASLRPLPGYTHDGTCQAVAMWRPGLSKPEIVVPLARDPQWTGVETAERLVAWHLQRPQASSRR
jgi:hypothetical protein